MESANWSDSSFVALTGPDPVNPFNRQDEDLAVANVASARGLENRVDSWLDEVVGYSDLKADFVGEFHFHRRSAIVFDRFHLAAMAAHLGDRQATDFCTEERFKDIVELLWTNDGDDQLHAAPSFVIFNGVATGALVVRSTGRTSTAPSPLL